MNLFANPMAIGSGVVLLALIVAFVVVRSRRRGRARAVELGAVSNQWVMEHRMGPGHDPSHWNQR